jgi:hypothetical protein
MEPSMTDTTNRAMDFASIAARAAARAKAQATGATGLLAADSAAMASEATRVVCEADALIQQVIGLLADNGSVDAALDLLHEAGQRTSSARYLACRAAEIAAKRPA